MRFSGPFRLSVLVGDKLGVYPETPVFTNSSYGTSSVEQEQQQSFLQQRLQIKWSTLFQSTPLSSPLDSICLEKELEGNHRTKLTYESQGTTGAAVRGSRPMHMWCLEETFLKCIVHKLDTKSKLLPTASSWSLSA